MWDKTNFLNKYEVIIFKLLNDLLFLLMAFFLLLIIADGILPGIISNYYDPAIIIILILSDVLLISFLERKLNLKLIQKSNKKTVCSILFIFILLMANAFFHLNIWLNLFLTLASLLAGYFIYRVFLDE